MVPAPSKPVVYDLISVILHHGARAVGGHYTACILSRGNWLHCDDDRVSVITMRDVVTHIQNQTAYILAYKRRE